jgi:hypothetical protein
MYALPTLYKARNLSTKRPVCAICLDRTRGRTEPIRLGYRVTVWLCPGHASHAFQTHYATGAPPADPAHHACHACTAQTPSRRTLQRWHTERRWLNRPP